MSLKNYIFATINTKSTTTFQTRGEDPVDSTIPTIIEGDSSESSMNWIKKAWSFISIEPVMICWILPSCLLYIAIENLSLEKVCDFLFYFMLLLFFFCTAILKCRQFSISRVALIMAIRMWCVIT